MTGIEDEGGDGGPLSTITRQPLFKWWMGPRSFPAHSYMLVPFRRQQDMVSASTPVIDYWNQRAIDRALKDISVATHTLAFLSLSLHVKKDSVCWMDKNLVGWEVFISGGNKVEGAIECVTDFFRQAQFDVSRTSTVGERLWGEGYNMRKIIISCPLHRFFPSALHFRQFTAAAYLLNHVRSEKDNHHCTVEHGIGTTSVAWHSTEYATHQIITGRRSAPIRPEIVGISIPDSRIRKSTDRLLSPSISETTTYLTSDLIRALLQERRRREEDFSFPPEIENALLLDRKRP